jgi:hypothetical protein
MKGAKRILSVFLLVVMLCTFFVFPADAAENLIDIDLSTWTIPTNNTNTRCATREDGVKYFHISDGLNGGVMVNCRLHPGAKYSLRGSYSIYSLRSSPALIVISVVDYSSGDFLFDYDSAVIVHQAYYNSNIDFRLSPVEFTVPSDFKNPRLFVYSLNFYSLYLSNLVVEENSIEKGILNSIKEGFNKLWEWLKGIWDSIKEIPTKIGQFITNLGDRISTFFSNLTNSIKGFFDNLWDKIWNGDGSVPPFDNNNKFAQVIEKLNEWTAKIKEFSGSVDSSADTVTGYLQSGTSFLNSAMGAFPAALTAVLGFALVFIVVRKVVGR